MEKSIEESLAVNLKKIMTSNNATFESMSYLAGVILQLAKQILSIKFESKSSIPKSKKIGSQSIVNIIWEGRNHAMHWEEGEPRKPVKEMLQALGKDFNHNIDFCNNNCLFILEALEWFDKESVIRDLKKILTIE